MPAGRARATALSPQPITLRALALGARASRPPGRARIAALPSRPLAHPSPPRPRAHPSPEPVRRRRAPYALAARDQVMRRLAAAGLPGRPSFTPVHLQPLARQPFDSQPSSCRPGAGD
ncbi:MAG: hypothetical protein M5U01_40695 [Ardenticatenaceae bacterium]|nr:hypothetical protein [Ardenticatenaceae bacterium]